MNEPGMRDVIGEDFSLRNLLPRTARAVLAGLLVPGWQLDGACASADPDMWFPDGATLTEVPRSVARICATCPVRKLCLAAAVLDGDEGIWAGTLRRPRWQARRAIQQGGDPHQVLDAVLDQAAEGVLSGRTAA